MQKAKIFNSGAAPANDYVSCLSKYCSDHILGNLCNVISKVTASIPCACDTWEL